MRSAFHLLAVLGALIVVPVLASGKEVGFKVWTETDRFKPGIVAVRSTPIRFKEVKFTSPWFATVEAGYVYSEDGAIGTYVLDVTYFGHDWMFWDQLTAKVGDDVRSLKLIGQPSREQVPLGLQEQARFEVPRDLFEKMTAAARIDFRINGKYYYEFYINATGTSYLKQLDSFVKENAPELRAQPMSGVVGSGNQEAGSVAPAYIQELRELAKLRDEGIISEEEFQARKQKVLGLDSPEKASPAETKDDGKTKEEKNSEKPPR